MPKTAKYTDLEPHRIFGPAAFETFGTWGKEADRIISAIDTKIADSSGKRSVEFLRQRISVALQRGNAAWKGELPEGMRDIVMPSCHDMAESAALAFHFS